MCGTKCHPLGRSRDSSGSVTFTFSYLPPSSTYILSR